jgi:ribonucleotide monophosphatase NagD (HAD superfamily)
MHLKIRFLSPILSKDTHEILTAAQVVVEFCSSITGRSLVQHCGKPKVTMKPALAQWNEADAKSVMINDGSHADRFSLQKDR